MIILKMKNYNMTSIKKLQKYKPYHQAKLIIINILQVKTYCLLNKNKSQNKLNSFYFPLGKAFAKQTKTNKNEEEEKAAVRTKFLMSFLMKK